VVSALKGSAGKTLEFVSPQQGLHLLARLPKGLPSQAAADIRAQAGVEGWLLSRRAGNPPTATGTSWASVDTTLRN
jgi:GntR family transcriptional regulator / MocR family aminotransferase